MSNLSQTLMEEIGVYSVEVSTTGNCAPHKALTDAVRAYDDELEHLRGLLWEVTQTVNSRDLLAIERFFNIKEIVGRTNEGGE